MVENWRQDRGLIEFFDDTKLPDYKIFKGASCPKDPKVNFIAKYDKEEISLIDMQYYLGLRTMERFIDAACAKVLDIPYEDLIRDIMSKTTDELINRYRASIGEFDK